MTKRVFFFFLYVCFAQTLRIFAHFGHCFLRIFFQEDLVTTLAWCPSSPAAASGSPAPPTPRRPAVAAAKKKKKGKGRHPPRSGLPTATTAHRMYMYARPTNTQSRVLVGYASRPHLQRKHDPLHPLRVDPLPVPFTSRRAK